MLNVTGAVTGMTMQQAMNNSMGADSLHFQAQADATLDSLMLAPATKQVLGKRSVETVQVEDDLTPLIQLKQLRKSFTKSNGASFNALDDIDLSIGREHHLVAVIGPDGSGKSTLLQILAGIMIPDGGWYALNLEAKPSLTIGVKARSEQLAQGVANAKNKRFDRKEKAHSVSDNIGYMSQSLGLYEDISVWENLKTFSQLRDLDVASLENESIALQGNASARNGSDTALLDRYLENLLNSVNLIKFRDYKAGSLSGGMKQKLALTCALSARPKLLLLDEPTVGVDPISRQELWNIIFSYIEQSHSYCIFSSLYLEEAECSSLTIFIKDGKLIYKGQVEPLKQQVQSQCFALYPASHLSYQKLARALMINLSQSKLLCDLCPRMGRIDLLTATEVTLQELDEDLQALLAKCYRPLNPDEYSLQRREPILEDAYINLTRAQTGQVMAILGSDYQVHGIHDNASGTNEYVNGCKVDSVATPRVAIDVQGVRKQFGKFTAVADSTFQVYQGEIFGLLGPNGAGKTTTFRMICALLNPSAGKILIQGLTLANAKSSVRATIGYVAQKFCLYRKMTLRQNLSYFGKSYGLSGKLLQERIAQMCEIFDLIPFLDESSENLPFGVQRSLSMACALIHRPSILFLDEATSGADPTSRRVFWQLISQLASQGTTIIVTTHFMEEAEYCDRFLIQDQGKILILGTPDEICDPKHHAMAYGAVSGGFQDAAVKEEAGTKTGIAQNARISIEEAFIACVQKAKAKQVEQDKAKDKVQPQIRGQGQGKESKHGS